MAKKAPAAKPKSYKELKEARVQAHTPPVEEAPAPPEPPRDQAAELAAAQEAEFQALLAAEEAAKAAEAAKVQPRPVYDGPAYQDRPEHHRHLCLECGTVWEHENGSTDHRCPEPGCNAQSKFKDHYKGPVPPSELDKLRPAA